MAGEDCERESRQIAVLDVKDVELPRLPIDRKWFRKRPNLAQLATLGHLHGGLHLLQRKVEFVVRPLL